MNRNRTILTFILSLCFLLVLAACSNSTGSASLQGPAGPAGPKGAQGVQGPAGKEGPQGKEYLPSGPGLKVKISKAEFPSDGKPVVTLTMTDNAGIPIKAEMLEGYGFTVAQVMEDSSTHVTRYQSLLLHDVDGKPYQLDGKSVQPAMQKASQAFADTGGAWNDQGDGIFTYTFKNSLNDPVDPNLLFVVGVYAYKDNRQAVANDVYSSILNGSATAPERQIVTNSACNLCHNPLRAHGGTRTAVALCVTCHTDQTTDPETGNTLNLKVLIHRLHFGRQLPSVQAGKAYMIVGHNQDVSNFSNDNWPQDLRYCITCHTGGAESANYKNRPNAAACTSCHDTTNLSTGENHPGGIQTDDQCSSCHAPDGDEFDASVTGAHTILTNSQKIQGLNLVITTVTGGEPGSSPVVKFKATNRAGQALDPTRLAYLAVTLAGPTSNYTNRWTETIVSAPSDPNPNPPPPAIKKADDGSYAYQLTAKIPEDASGTYAVGMEGYVMEQVVSTLDPVRVTAYNPVSYFALGGGKIDSRREVIDRTKCNVCHMELSAHGTVRKNVEYCVLCHNTQATDEARRPPEAMPPTSINFPILIHRLHKGDQAADPLKVFGYGGKAVDFSAVVFPGDLAACQTCHLPNTYTFPLAKGIQPTTITQEGKVISTTLPTRAICSSCHDSPETGGHIDLQTTAQGVETCLVCHGPGREVDVSKVHH